ncbi:MAG: hypothetical protein ACR2LX_00170 [Jatrophihabitans sp.]
MAKSSTKDQLAKNVLANKQAVRAGMVVVGVLAAGSLARRKRTRLSDRIEVAGRAP